MGAMWQLVLVLGATLVLMAPRVAGCGRGAMQMKNNGYRHIVIAVGEDVPETPQLVERIKQVFTATSRSLYRATRIRAYLADMTILLPSTWTRRPEYTIAGAEQMEKSDVMISNFNFPSAGNTSSEHSQHGVFVVKATECGKPGHFMHISPTVLLNEKATVVKTPLDKILVHEFAHLRYGVFDEYPSGNDPHFYHGPGGVVEATRCSRAITGWMYDIKTKLSVCKAKGQLPDENCRFRALELKGRRRFSSLMYRANLKHVDGFCDGDESEPKQLHNPDSPSMQNRLCNGRSVWEVMRSHEDFANSNNPPRMIYNTAPTFTVVQTLPKRYVLVLDRSLSMSIVPEHLPNLRRGCSNFILNIVNDGESVGIVWFAKTGQRAAELKVIDENTRWELLPALKTNTGPYTSIGSGIREAIAVLKHNGGRPDGTAEGGHLIVVSDGQENIKPTILDMMSEIFREKVIIHSIAFTNNAASNADRIARETGGLSFLYNDAANSNALHEAFREIGSRNQNPKHRKIPISSTAETLAPGGELRGSVGIDSTLGTDTEFIFDYTGRDINVMVTSPTGKEYVKTSNIVTKDTDNGIYMFRFKGHGETGRWLYRATITDGSKQKVSATVVSRMNLESGKYPIMAQAYWGYSHLAMGSGKPVIQPLYASVSQGYSSVLKAEVVAVIEKPDKTVERLPLQDTGFGADLHKDDGIYSGYFTGFVANKRYNVKVMVNSRPATVISSVRVVGTKPPTKDTHTYSAPADISVNHLQRMASGGSFQLTNYMPSVGKVYAPSQVTDLTVGVVDVETRTVQLTWTAPGAVLDKGKVSEYEIRYANDFKGLRENFAGQMIVTQSMLMKGSLTNPSSPGMREAFAIQMPSAGNITYVFRLLSKDLDNRIAHSQPSNLVSAGMTVFVNKPKTRSVSDSVSMSTTAIILISILGVLLLIALILALVMISRHVYVYRQYPYRPSSPLVISPNPLGKVHPVSPGAVSKARKVGPASNTRLNTLNVEGLNRGEFTKTVGTGPFTTPQRDTLVNVD